MGPTRSIPEQDFRYRMDSDRGSLRENTFKTHRRKTNAELNWGPTPLSQRVMTVKEDRRPRHKEIERDWEEGETSVCGVCVCCLLYTSRCV